MVVRCAADAVTTPCRRFFRSSDGSYYRIVTIGDAGNYGECAYPIGEIEVTWGRRESFIPKSRALRARFPQEAGVE